MSRTWHSPHEHVGGSWWARHWANPNFSGGLIGVVSVLLVMVAGLVIGVEALHLDLGHLDFAGLVGK